VDCNELTTTPVLLCRLPTAYSLLISAWVYPVVVHWVWAPLGWLSGFNANPLFGTGMIDFAGCGVVHMVGAMAGLMGCLLVGPRLGRFDSNGKPVDMPGHSATLVVLGTCLLWFGWYGFNPGSTLNIVGADLVSSQKVFLTSGRAAVTTTLSGAAGVLTCLITGFAVTKSWDLLAVCNGALVGFVSITAGAAVVEPWAAIIAGIIGALIFDATCWLWLKLRIDDPLCASPMHGICGAWGLIFTGLFATRQYVWEAGFIMGGSAENGMEAAGFGGFMGGGGKLLACQIIGILVITAWVCGHMGEDGACEGMLCACEGISTSTATLLRVVGCMYVGYHSWCHCLLTVCWFEQHTDSCCRHAMLTWSPVYQRHPTHPCACHMCLQSLCSSC
jgi:Amt family ammonium transporter